MGIEPTRKLDTKRLPDAGGTHRSALEHIGAIIGRELDVEDDPTYSGLAGYLPHIFPANSSIKGSMAIDFRKRKYTQEGWAPVAKFLQTCEVYELGNAANA